MIGQSFSPLNSYGSQTSGAPRGSNNVQEAVRVLNLRLPRFVQGGITPLLGQQAMPGLGGMPQPGVPQPMAVPQHPGMSPTPGGAPGGNPPISNMPGVPPFDMEELWRRLHPGSSAPAPTIHPQGPPEAPGPGEGPRTNPTAPDRPWRPEVPGMGRDPRV